MLVYFMAIWSILLQFGMFYGYLVNFMVYSIFPPVLVCCTKKNLATLVYIGPSQCDRPLRWRWKSDARSQFRKQALRSIS
jgi:hypothetical protein